MKDSIFFTILPKLSKMTTSANFVHRITSMLSTIAEEKQYKKKAEYDIETLVKTLKNKNPPIVITLMNKALEEKKNEVVTHNKNIKSKINELFAVVNKEFEVDINADTEEADMTLEKANAIIDADERAKALAVAEAADADERAKALAVTEAADTEEAKGKMFADFPPLVRNDIDDDSEITTEAEEAAKATKAEPKAIKATKAEEAALKVTKAKEAAKAEEWFNNYNEMAFDHNVHPAIFCGKTIVSEADDKKESPWTNVKFSVKTVKKVLTPLPTPTTLKSVAKQETKQRIPWYKKGQKVNSIDDLGPNAAALNGILGEKYVFNPEYFKNISYLAATFYLLPTCIEDIHVIVDENNNSDVIQEKGGSEPNKITGVRQDGSCIFRSTFVAELTTAAIKSVYDKLSGNRKKFVVVYKELDTAGPYKYKFNIMIHKWREEWN